eukprot:3577261-Pleurochrysis_carterae.AAC.1
MSHNVQAHAVARLKDGQDIMQRLMKSLITQMQQMKTRDKDFQEPFLHMTRKEHSANTAPSAILNDLSRGGRSREQRGR